MFRIEELKTMYCNKFKLQLQKHWISDNLPEYIREVYLTSKTSSEKEGTLQLISC
jgi:hypothetical protein